MFSPNYFRYIQARSIYGNAFPKEKKIEKTHQYLQLLSSSQEKLVEKALDSQKVAIVIFCHPEISQNLSMSDMIEVFLFYILFTEKIINEPVFRSFARNITKEELKHFFQNKCSVETFEKICKMADSEPIKSDFTGESHALIYTLGKMFFHIDFKNLDNEPAENCRKLLKRMLAMLDAYSDTFRLKLTRVLNALSNVNFIRELKKLEINDVMFFSKLFREVAEEVLKTPEIFDKLSAKQLEALCLQHEVVADQIMADEKLLRKTFSDPNVEGEKLIVQQAKLASPHSAIVKKLFPLFAPAFCPPYSSHEVSEQYGLCLFFLGKEQPSIAKKILQTPYLRHLLNGQHLARLEHTTALWEAMEKICIKLTLPPSVDPSLETEISDEVGKLKIG